VASIRPIIDEKVQNSTCTCDAIRHMTEAASRTGQETWGQEQHVAVKACMQAEQDMHCS
jgi:hypothetical protein